jgi:hypothetical protein
MSSGEMLMMGVQSGNGMAGIRMKSHRNQKFVRRYSHDRSERSDQVRLKGDSNALYVTALDDRICSTYVLEMFKSPDYTIHSIK